MEGINNLPSNNLSTTSFKDREYNKTNYTTPAMIMEMLKFPFYWKWTETCFQVALYVQRIAAMSFFNKQSCIYFSQNNEKATFCAQ